MSSYTGNSKPWHTSIALCGALASLALTSCADGQKRLAQLRPPPYLALTVEGVGAGPSMRQTGSFAEQNGCVVFRSADGGTMVTPVFARGDAALVTDGSEWLGLYVHDLPVVMNKVYRLSGANLGGGMPALVSPAPGGCPSSYVVVHTVGPTIADGIATRFVPA